MVYECYMKRYVKGILEGLVKMYQMAVQRYVESKFAMKDSFMVNEMAYGNNIEETDERFMVYRFHDGLKVYDMVCPKYVKRNIKRS